MAHEYQGIEIDAGWKQAQKHAPARPDWYEVRGLPIHPNALFGQRPARYFDGIVWRVAGPGTPQSDMGDHAHHEWRISA